MTERYLGETPEGHEVDRVGMKVIRLDKAMTQAMRVRPTFTEAGDTVTFAVRAVKVKDNYEYELAGGSLTIEHVQVFSAVGATFIPRALVDEAIDELGREASGQMALDLCTVDHIAAWVEDTELTECPRCGVALPIPTTGEGLHE